MSLKVALMRSIVINDQRVRMEDARALVTQIGGTEVRSVIATGNLLFRSDKEPRRLEQELERACERFYGRVTEMVVKTAGEWHALVTSNPFPEEAIQAPSRLLVWAMRTPLPDHGLEQLRRRAAGAERIERIPSGDVYIWFGESLISNSKIPAGFGLKALGAVGTNRNWNTATKISHALEEMSKQPERNSRA